MEEKKCKKVGKNRRRGEEKSKWFRGEKEKEEEEGMRQM